MKKIIETLIKRFAPVVREKIEDYAKVAIEKLRVSVENYNYSQQIDTAVDFVVNKLKLPLWLKPFKWVIKKIIKDTLINLVEEGIEKLNK